MKRLIRKSIKASSSLYDQLKSVVENPADDLDTHASDIYVLKTPETTKVIQNYYDEMGLKNQSTQFIDEITHRKFYEIPFGYINQRIANRNISSKSIARGRKVTAATDWSIDEMEDTLLNNGISEDALHLVTDINGRNEQTMCDILYVRFGYRSFEQLEDE